MRGWPLLLCACGRMGFDESAAFDASLPITTSSSRISTGNEPSIALAPNGYVLAWQGVPTAPPAPDATVAVLDDSGTVVGAPLRIGAGWEPNVVATGAGYGVAFTDYDHNFLVTLDRSGAPVAMPAQYTSSMGVVTNGPQLVASDVGFGSLWMSWTTNRIGFARLDPNGGRLGPELDVIGEYSDPDAVSLAWSGTQYGAAWVRYNGSDVVFARIDPAGNVLGVTHYPDPESRGTSVSWDEDAWVIAVPSAGTDFDLVRVDPSGTMVRSDHVATPVATDSISIVSTPAGLAAFVVLALTDSWQIVLVPIDRSGTIGSPTVVVDTPGCISSFTAIADRAGFALAWANGRGLRDCTSQDLTFTQIRNAR